jgi:hypothetical protein
VHFGQDLLDRSPYRDLHPRFLRALERLATFPAPEEYDELLRRVPQAGNVELPRFVCQRRVEVERAGGYEQHIARLAAVPTRSDNWHDFFNMVVWAHFPKLRWALNALHVDPQVGLKDPRNGRAPAQNLAATFDESGLLVLSTSQSVLDDLRELKFRRVFWERRAELMATTRFWLVGHGLFESLMLPPPGLAARSIQLHVPALPAAGSDALRFEVDALIAARIHGWRTSRAVLDPLPLLCIPGYADNDTQAFYDDPRNIRFEPISRRPREASASSATHTTKPVGD